MSAKDLLAVSPPTYCSLPALFGSLFRKLRKFARAFRHRREAAALIELNSHLLADIGINRIEVHDALSEPFWRDPTLFLDERVSARRAHRNRCGIE